MSNPKIYGRRKLPYPYSYTTTQEYDASDTPNTFEPAIGQSGIVAYVLEMTDDQVRKFSSALTAGADLIYPDEQINVIAPWLKARTMAICDQVADCIDNNAAVQQAISDQIANNTQIIQEILNAGSGPEPDIGPDVNDAVWGGAFALAEWIQTTVVDVSEAVQAATELGEAFVGALNLPGIDKVPVARVATFVVDISDAGAAAIIAEADQTSLETIACWAFNELRCNNNGEFSFTALQNATGALVVDLGLGKATLSTAVVAMFALVAPAIFARYYEIGLNDPSNDWQALCSACSGRWTIVYDFTQSDGGWTVASVTSGEYTLGVGWELEKSAANNNNLLSIAKLFGGPFQLDYYEVTYDLSNIGANAQLSLVGDLNGSLVANQVNQPPTTGTDVNVIWQPSTAITIDEVRLYLANRAFAPSQGGSGLAKRVVIGGPGPQPT